MQTMTRESFDSFLDAAVQPWPLAPQSELFMIMDTHALNLLYQPYLNFNEVWTNHITPLNIYRLTVQISSNGTRKRKRRAVRSPKKSCLTSWKSIVPLYYSYDDEKGGLNFFSLIDILYYTLREGIQATFERLTLLLENVQKVCLSLYVAHIVLENI